VNLHHLSGPPAPELARALATFEEQFTYPLGPGRWFRISHGDDYPRFFRAIGETACFVAERDGQVLGTVGIAVRRLLMPDGSERDVVYLGDLKVLPDARGGRVLPRLAAVGLEWATARAAAAFAVVMDGTRVTPDRYTGRLGTPALQALAKVIIFRLPAPPTASTSETLRIDAAAGEDCYRRLSAGRYASLGGSPAERSEVDPAWLVAPDGAACGRLEDTRRAKRLFADTGSEMVSAHLSCFAFRTPDAGAVLLRAARARAARLGFPALFAAVDAADAPGLRAALGDSGAVEAPATVYGTGLAAGPAWHVNTAEV
jgi:predicted N-acetyltransferase YhbS